MHVAINAIPVRPGGGLTVLQGVTHGLRQSAPDWKVSVLSSHRPTHDAMKSTTGAENVHRVLPNSTAPGLTLWQNVMLGRWLRREKADVLLNVNHFTHNVHCPQVVYHLNLLRFQDGGVRVPSPYRIQDRLRDWLARTALRRASANVFESRHLQEVAKNSVSHPVENASVIYIGLPDELSLPALRSSASNSTTRRLVAVTSPAEHKDNPTLIRMLADLVARSSTEEWHLDIAGGTDLEVWEPTRKLARELSVEDRITWHGFCDTDQLTKLFSRSLCLVSTSRVESFAMVALEAMARGCPPIVANCAAMPESVGNAGMLASPGDSTAFADEVERIALDAQLRDRLVARGLERAARFRWSECGARFARLFESLYGD